MEAKIVGRQVQKTTHVNSTKSYWPKLKGQNLFRVWEHHQVSQ